MTARNEILLAIENEPLSVKDLVSILTLLLSKININTYSGMAESEGITTDGVRKSNAYQKLKIGKALMAIKGVRENYHNFPF